MRFQIGDKVRTLVDGPLDYAYKGLIGTIVRTTEQSGKCLYAIDFSDGIPFYLNLFYENELELVREEEKMTYNKSDLVRILSVSVVNKEEKENFDLILKKAKMKMNKRQSKTFETMVTQQRKLDYANTFLGKENQNIRITKPKQNKSFEGPVVYTYNRPLKEYWKEVVKEMKELYSNKKPFTSHEDWIGVEIECFLKKEDFQDYSNTECTCECDCGDDCEGYCRDNCECEGDYYVDAVRRYVKKKHIEFKNVTIEYDGSLNADDRDYFGVEVKVLFRLSNPSNLKKVCEFLKDHNAIVNKTCGLHVHLDSRKYKDKKEQKILVSRFEDSLPYLTKMVPKSRVNRNQYCLPGASWDSRYHMVNATSLSKHNTIEIRLHSGTTQYDKIFYWASILSRIKNAPVIKYSSLTLKFKAWMEMVGLNESESLYMLERVSKFNPDILIEQGSLLTAETLECEDSETAA